MKVLIVTAMDEELSYIDKEKLMMDGVSVDFLVTGVGKINASSELSRILMVHRGYDLVLNIGTCGGVANCEIFDVVYNSIVRSVDVDYCGDCFDTEWRDHFGVEFDDIRPAVMFSNDKFITPEYYATISDEMDADNISVMGYAVTYDMETFAYASVCRKYNIPFFSLRVVTDKPIVPDNYSVFEVNVQPGMLKINNMLSDILMELRGVLL